MSGRALAEVQATVVIGATVKLDWRRYVKPDEFIEIPFLCPECGGKVSVEIEEWVTGTGEITEGGFHLCCTEEELEPADPNYWSHRYWQSDWQDVITVCYRWLQKHIRVGGMMDDQAWRSIDWNNRDWLPMPCEMKRLKVIAEQPGNFKSRKGGGRCHDQPSSGNCGYGFIK